MSNNNALTAVTAIAVLLATDLDRMWPDEERTMLAALRVAQRLVK